MSTLTARIALNIAAELTNALDLSVASSPLKYGPTYVFTDGAGLNQANKIWTDTRTLAASANEDLDLNGTTLQDGLGVNLALTKVKAIVVVADAGNTNDVVVGGAASNAVTLFSDVTDKLPVKPGGLFAFVAPTAAGVTVTAATGDLLRIANGGAGTAVTYSIVVIGA